MLNENKLYFQLKETLQFQLELIKENLLNMDKGKTEIVIDNEKLVVYVTKTTATVYIDLSKNLDYNIIESKLNILFNRKIVIKKTFYNYIIPAGYYYTSNGMSIKRTKKEKIDGEYETITTIEKISNKWIFVVADVYSKESDVYQNEVLSIDPYTKQEIKKLCTKETLSRYSLVLNFLSSSLNVNIEEGKRSDYTKFFFDFINENEKKLQKKNTIPTLGWNDNLTGFAPYDEKLHLDFSRDKYNFLKNVTNAFLPKTKNIEEFKKRLFYHSKNPFADFAISCSFAAPLLKIVGVRSFLLNYYGPSKNLKSLSLRIGLSIFGKYSNLEMSGSDTINVIKSKIHKLQNLPCYIDEIIQKGKKYNQVINGYDFGNERDRHRLDKNSEIKEAKTWRTIGMCSSESSIHKDNDMAGEINRSLCLNVDCRPAEFVNDENQCHKYASDYYRFLELNYGLIGKRYIEEIIRIKDTLTKWYIQINQKLYSINKNKNLTDHIASISIVCLGNYIYRKLLYNIDDIFYSINLGITILKHLQTKEELSSEQKYLNSIYEFYEINKNNFVNRSNKDAFIRTQIFGAIDQEANEIIFILGPLKEHLLKNGFDWNYKSTLVTNNFIKYSTRKINNVAGKRIIIPIEKKDIDIDEDENEKNCQEAI